MCGCSRVVNSETKCLFYFVGCCLFLLLLFVDYSYYVIGEVDVCFLFFCCFLIIYFLPNHMPTLNIPM